MTFYELKKKEREKKTKHNQSNKTIPGVQISNFINKGSAKLS